MDVQHIPVSALHAPEPPATLLRHIPKIPMRACAAQPSQDKQCGQPRGDWLSGLYKLTGFLSTDYSQPMFSSKNAVSAEKLGTPYHFPYWPILSCFMGGLF